jgi:hypothetical protein
MNVNRSLPACSITEALKCGMPRLLISGFSPVLRGRSYTRKLLANLTFRILELVERPNLANAPWYPVLSTWYRSTDYPLYSPGRGGSAAAAALGTLVRKSARGSYAAIAVLPLL